MCEMPLDVGTGRKLIKKLIHSILSTENVLIFWEKKYITID